MLKCVECVVKKYNFCDSERFIQILTKFIYLFKIKTIF